MNYNSEDNNGVSPVIGVILMVSITIILAGSVYLISNSYINDAGGEPEIINIRVDIDVNGIEERSSEDGTLVHTYSGIHIDVISDTFDWENYKIIVNSKRVFTIRSNSVNVGEVPDASSDPAPENWGKTNAGGNQWFTEHGYRDDLLPMRIGGEYSVKVVNTATNTLVWQNTIIAHE